MRHLQRSIPTLNNEDRVFCAGHYFNLVVKAMLFGQASQFEKDLAGTSDTETFQVHTPEKQEEAFSCINVMKTN